MSSGAKNLTKAIKDNLSVKTKAFLERSELNWDKFIIFTDNAALWEQGPKVLCLTNEPLPPIPAGYNRDQSYDIVEEMIVFVAEYLHVHSGNQEAYWGVYNSGDEDKPQVHLLISSDPTLEEMASSLLRYEGKVPEIPPRPSSATASSRSSRAARWRHLSTVSEEYESIVPDITLQQPTPSQSLDSPESD